MNRTAAKVAAIVGIGAGAVLLGRVAIAQPPPTADGPTAAKDAEASSAASSAPAPAPSSPSPEDEIVVEGRRPQQLLAEIERAENAFYARFNAINGDHEFDIVCRNERLTGSNIPRRECRPQFELDVQAAQGANEAHALQGFFGPGSGEFVNEDNYKRGLLKDKMRKLAAEDPQLGQALKHLVDLEDAYKASVKSARR